MITTSEEAKVRLNDYALISLVILCISIAAYHPFYFGDELFSFAFGLRHEGGLLDTFAELNSYKPRILMNFLWASIVAFEAPRWVAMAVSAFALATCSALIYSIARQSFGASRLAANLVAIALPLSRYGFLFYYDYVSATVETISLAFVLLGLRISSNAVFGLGPVTLRRQILSVVCFLLAVLVHERFIAGIAACMSVVTLYALIERSKCNNPMRFVFPLMSIALPLLLVIFLVKTLSHNPITMGTSGQVVTISGETFYRALTYLCNVFLGSNFGPTWFVGALNQDNPHAGVVFRSFAVLLAICWGLPWLAKRPSNIVMNSDGRPRWRAAWVLCAFIAGMILIASLPGADRQEGRWMFPVMAALLLLVVSLYKGIAFYALVLALGACQLFYIGFGSLDRIASISASSTARQLGRAMDAIEFPGTAGILVAVPEPDTSWVLGGADGRAFCYANLSRQNCLYSSRVTDQTQRGNYGFGLMPNEIGRHGDWSYRYLPRPQVALILNPGKVPEGGELLGNESDWTGWTFDNVKQLTPHGVVLGRLAENFMKVESSQLDGRLIVYSARAIQGKDVPMRLQVNWHDSQGKFINAFIDVVKVGAKPKDHSAMLVAPGNAAYGLVYATLHDGSVGQVLLRSVRLVDLSYESTGNPPAQLTCPH